VFVVLTVAFFSITLGRRLLPPLLPVIIEDLSITPFAAGVALSVFTVVRAVAQYPGGRYADRLSRETVVTGSLLCGVVGFGLLAVVTGYPTFLLGVAVIGAASGLFVPANRALLSDLFVEKRGRAFGINMTASDVTGIVAAGVAVLIVARATWQTAFLLAVPAVVAVGLAFRWVSREGIVLRRVSFGVRETVGRLSRQPRLRLVVSAYALRSFVTSSVTNFLPVFLIATQGFSFEFASGVYAVRFLVGLGAKPLSGTLGDTYSRPLIAIGSLAVTGGGIATLILAPTAPLAIAGVVLYALGQKSFSAPMQAYLMDSFPDDSMGGDLGATRTLYMGVGSVGPAAVGYLAGVTDYALAYASTLVVLLAAAGIIVWVERGIREEARDAGG
jgi:MFS family permease